MRYHNENCNRLINRMEAAKLKLLMLVTLEEKVEETVHKIKKKDENVRVKRRGLRNTRPRSWVNSFKPSRYQKELIHASF